MASTDEYNKTTDMLNLKPHKSDLLVKSMWEYGAVEFSSSQFQYETALKKVCSLLTEKEKV